MTLNTQESILKKTVILASVTVFLLVAYLLTGCGGSGDDSEAADSDSSGTESSQPEETTGLYASDLVDMDTLTGWASVEGEGMGAVTGGGDETPILVTTYEELVELVSDNEPRVILIQGTITCDAAIHVGSNKTIVGLDEDATIEGGFEMDDVANIIISNLNIDARTGRDVVDGIAARNSHHLWFDHLNVHDASDGLLDITLGSDYCTVSWCKFSYASGGEHRLACLIGSGTGHDDTDVGKLNVTYHHCWFGDNVAERMPRILYGKCHVYNNYYSSKTCNYCIGVACYASVLIENNYFKDVTNPHYFMYESALPAYITARGNDYDNTSGDQDNGRGGIGLGYVEPFTEPPYEYTLDEAADVPEIVTEGAGPRSLLELAGGTETDESAADADSDEEADTGSADVDTDADTAETDYSTLEVGDSYMITYDEETDTYSYEGTDTNGDGGYYVISNPFAGLDLSEDPEYGEDGRPSWSNGVTISYWVYTPKSNITDGAVLNFNLYNNRQMSYLDAWKYEVCQNYSDSDEAYTMGEESTYIGTDGETYTVLEGAGEYVCYNPDYPADGCYTVDEESGYVKAYKKGTDSDDEENWTWLNYLGEGLYESYCARYDEEGGENSLISEAEISGSLSIYASGTFGFRQDNNTGLELNSNLPGYGDVVSIQTYNQYYFWGNGSSQTNENGLETPTMAETGAWHFVVVVIKNDSVQYYMDGTEIGSDYLKWLGRTLEDSDSVSGSSFNLGYGSNTSYLTRNPASIFTTGMTMLDFITNEDTVLTVGGIGCAAANLSQDDLTTPNGMQVKELTFYAEPISTDSIEADHIETDVEPLE
ncbi:MAG: hypothetical protein LUC27_04745 [Lachnospiraceae bacterium]|nr:hypothetical protein [Lachnospiraceae bacterium]